MQPMTIQQAFVLAVQHLQAGRIHEAEPIYRQILAAEPNHSGALHHLGVIAHQMGRNVQAVDMLRRAIALSPADVAARNNLGNILRIMGNLDEAIETYRDLIRMQPGFSAAHYNLGIALKDRKQTDDAIDSYRQAIALQPNYSEAFSALGLALFEKRDVQDAIAAFRQAIILRPDNSEAYNGLGDALQDTGQLDEALAAFRKAISLRPNFPEACNNLGNTLKRMGHLDEAVAAYHQAIALRPAYPEALNNLGLALHDMGQFEDALLAFRKAIATNPESSTAHANFGDTLREMGRLDEALAEYRRVIAIDPGNSIVHSNLVYFMSFHPDADARAIADEQRRWNSQHAGPLALSIQPHSNDRDPDRRLRIGYVSPDFREHVIGYNMLPLLANHSAQDFEVFCYSAVTRVDAITEQFKVHADCWRDIEDVTDEALAAQIRADGIDILVDLTLHLDSNRLMAFTIKPAPVQVTFAGYPGSTGLTAIDYRLSDPHLDPPGMDESIYSEKTVRLSHSFWCYDSLDCSDIPVNSLPAMENGFVTFGCLNNFCKINDSVLRLWAGVLRAVPDSRLLLLAPEDVQRRYVLDCLKKENIDRERIEFVARQPRREYLESHHRIDLGLDTLPYNGHTTSLDSLWMGVPVVTLVGRTVVGRAGVSQLMNLDLPELIAESPEEYGRIAAVLAADLPRLAQLRSTLRGRMQDSPLMDARGFARDIEAAYRQMWRQYCAQSSPAAMT
jgi:predicted O-linked N-acetylglucosamine transferase (SPINDLY family)